MTTARILVVDDLQVNRDFLQAKLEAQYFEVLCAGSGAEAVNLARDKRPDIVLLDVNMPDMDGFAVCRDIKAHPLTDAIPVVMITATGDRGARLRGLEVGADDFLVRPFPDVALYARVRNLVRLKLTMDELRDRNATLVELGVSNALATDQDQSLSGRVAVICEDEEAVADLVATLEARHKIDILALNGGSELNWARLENADVIVVDDTMTTVDPLRICARVRASDSVRSLPLLICGIPSEGQRLAKALELGVNDYAAQPLDLSEVELRLGMQIRRKRYADRLRNNVEQGLTMSLIDPLTQLYNRRYLERHLQALTERSHGEGRYLGLIACDLDHFKAINDRYGHAAGDQILQGVAALLRRCVRSVDLVSRTGGEEFSIVLPDTDIYGARAVAERIRADMESTLHQVYDLDGELANVRVTASFGVVAARGDAVDGQVLLKQADRKLFQSKEGGRNQVAAADDSLETT